MKHVLRLVRAVMVACLCCPGGVFGQTEGPALYQSPIPDTMNVRFIENHVTIERPARAVFDWVTTWGNLPKWLPVTYGVRMVHGTLEEPSKLGDVMVEIVNPANTTGIDKQYTVVAYLPGFLWTVAGQDIVDGKPSERIQWVATYAVSPVDAGHSVFARVFQTVRVDVANSAARRPVDNPEIIQRALLHLKQTIEEVIAKP